MKAHTRRHTLLIEEPQSLPAMPLERLRRAPDWAVVANNIAFMAVPRSIPANFAATGWVIGILALVYSSVVTYDTGLVIGQLCESSGATSFPELAAEAIGRWSARHGWSAERRELGRRLAHGLTLSMQFATYYLAEVCELIYFEQYFGQIFGASPLCQWQWLLIGALIALPVLQVPAFHEGRWVALLLGLLPLAFNVLVFLYEIALVRPWACTPGPTFSGGAAEGPQSGRVFLGLTAFAYAFGGHGVYPEEWREI